MDHPRALLARWGIRPKKRYGQNFLMDGSAARRIARLCLSSSLDFARDDTVKVIEIGAGTGALTHALLEEGVSVTAIEVDPDLVAILRSREDLHAANVVEADALEFDYATWAGDRPWSAAGNLPYNIATPLIVRLAEMTRGPQSMTFMIQKDVADRLCAQPGTAAYGSLTIAVQYWMRVERAFTLGPASFYPAPKVRSSVVAMTRRTQPPVTLKDPELFWKVVRGAFAYRRKTLANSLSLALGIERSRVERAMAASNLSVELRGERLDLDDYARLADALAQQ